MNGGMTVERFFELFCEELKGLPDLWYYYKFNKQDKSFEFRKAYFCQRLQFIADHLADKKNALIWDCGCGFGTTALFLAMNGVTVYGNTVEWYLKTIDQRKKFWNQYGNADLFTAENLDLFDAKIPDSKYDYIIVQDTLHHLEPINDAMKLFKRVLKASGKMVVVEINGNNIVESLKYFKQRGFKRVITYYDETMNKEITMGNENIRSLKTWTEIFKSNSFTVSDVGYIRYYYPFFYNGKNTSELMAKEQKLWQNNSFAREYFFFGMNFILQKQG